MGSSCSDLAAAGPLFSISLLILSKVRGRRCVHFEPLKAQASESGTEICEFSIASKSKAK